MVKYLRKNMVFPANSGIVPDFLSKYKLNGFSYNPDTSSFLLNSIDTINNSFKTFDLYTTSDYLDICEYLQSKFSELGLRLNLKVNPPSIHRELVLINLFVSLEALGLQTTPIQKIIYNYL